MSELGRHLKEARLQKGMSLDDVQEVTKIRKKYLEAIEAGDYKVLPGSFYVRAFIKTYAEAVGVNPDELMEEHGNVPAAPVDTTMETVIQKRSRKPETERNAKWLPTLLMWTFPVLILVVIYLYASSTINDSGPKKADNASLTEATQDPAKVKPSPTAAGGEQCPLRQRMRQLQLMQEPQLLLRLLQLQSRLHRLLRERSQLLRTVNQARRRSIRSPRLLEAKFRS